MSSNTTGIANIKVIGIGGGGNNAINRMIDSGVTSAKFIAANTDMQSLNMSLAPIQIQLGAKLTKGLGAGADPEIGQRAAEESREEIIRHLQDTDLLFITAGMGGGTGTGAAPVVAEIARDLGILTIAVVTKPFDKFEGKKRMDNANVGIEKLREFVDTMLIIPNEKINMIAPKNTSILKAFNMADEILRQGVQGISDLIVTSSLINLDFADIKTIMKNRGNAHIGIGRGKGENKTLDAVRIAVQSPLLETSIQGATGIIVNVTGDEDLSLSEVSNAVSLIQEVVDPSANIIFGAGIDKNLKDEVVITVIATGFDTARSVGKSFNPYVKSREMPKELQNTKTIEEIYNFAPTKPIEKEEEKQEPIQDIPSPRIDVKSKNVPPFLIRLHNKNN